MKKTIAILFIVVFATSMIFAQGALPKKGDLFVGGKIALAGIRGADFGITVGAEKILQEDFLNLGDIPASLGAGAIFGYASWGDAWGGIKNSGINDFWILGRAYYHADVLKNDKIDTYVTFGLGLRIVHVNYPEPPADYQTFYGFGYLWPKDFTETDLISESSLGIRYFLTKALSVAAELGYGIGAVRIGVDLTL
jgi:hypothetical protein